MLYLLHAAHRTELIVVAGCPEKEYAARFNAGGF